MAFNDRKGSNCEKYKIEDGFHISNKIVIWCLNSRWGFGTFSLFLCLQGSPSLLAFLVTMPPLLLWRQMERKVLVSYIFQLHKSKVWPRGKIQRVLFLTTTHFIWSKVRILTEVNDAWLIKQVTIGTPPQIIDVSLDTGSSELWVNPYCAGSYNPTVCDALPRYDPTNSSTAVDQDTTFDISYGTGDVEGEYWRDTVTLAGKYWVLIEKIPVLTIPRG